MAIKINVSQQDQEKINQMLEESHYARQKRKFHCTIGFIEKMIPSEEASSFGQTITHDLQQLIDQEPLDYEVDRAAHLFGHVLVFIPTLQSQARLKKLNLWLDHRIQEISGKQWGLNEQSVSENYKPHLTLWHTHRPDHRFKKLEKVAGTHPSYHLTDASYVLFNQ